MVMVLDKVAMEMMAIFLLALVPRTQEAVVDHKTVAQVPVPKVIFVFTRSRAK